MTEKITTTEIYSRDKTKLRTIKDKKNLPGLKDSIRFLLKEKKDE